MKSFRDLGGGKALCRCISFHERCSCLRVNFPAHRFSRELVRSHTTHLVTNSPEGAKYEMALRFGNGNSNCPIEIVTAAWLDETNSTRRRAQEDAFRLNRLTALPKAALSNLLENINQSMLFADCVFHLVGFDENDTSTATTTTTTRKVQLSRLIRRGTGTIYWDMNESVTHIVVNDGCEDVLR